MNKNSRYGNNEVLKYGAENNYALWKEYISNEAVKQFGLVGSVVETGENYLPQVVPLIPEFYEQEPVMPDKTDMSDDMVKKAQKKHDERIAAYHMRYEEHRNKVESRNVAAKIAIRKLEDCSIKEPLCYGLIANSLSLESMDACQRHKDFDDCRRNMDPAKLLRIIQATHAFKVSSNMDQVRAAGAIQAFHTIKQGGQESIVSCWSSLF